VAEDELAHARVPAPETLVEGDRQTRGRVDDRVIGGVLQRRIADERVRAVGGEVSPGLRSEARDLSAEEAADVVLVVAVVDAPVLVLALEGIGPDVLLADHGRVTGAVADGFEAGLADEARDQGPKVGLVELRPRGKRLAAVGPVR